MEVDEQQVNLTRFNLLYPEKRTFFLEGQGIFNFGIGAGPNVNGADVPTLFFSRQIGLSRNQPVPIIAGGRVTGKVGRLPGRRAQHPDRRQAVARRGVHQLQRGAAAARRPAAQRRRRAVHESRALAGRRRARAHLRRGRRLQLLRHVEHQRLRGAHRDARRRRATTSATAGSSTTPATATGWCSSAWSSKKGSTRKSGSCAAPTCASGRARPGSARAPAGSAACASTCSRRPAATSRTTPGVLESRQWDETFGLDLNNGDTLRVQATQQYEFLARPFVIDRAATIPVGGYSFNNLALRYTLGAQRWFASTLSVEQGSFYGGDKTTIGVSAGRFNLTNQIQVQPALSVNRVDLPYGRFTATQAQGRVVYTLTPRAFVAALLQYNSSSRLLGTNLRWRWEYIPGSEVGTERALSRADRDVLDAAGEYRVDALGLVGERAVQRVHDGLCDVRADRRPDEAGVIVDQIELVRVEVRGRSVDDVVERLADVLAARRIVEDGHELRTSDASRRGVEGDVVTAIGQSVREQSNDPLDAAVANGRHGEPRRGDLGDAHRGEGYPRVGPPTPLVVTRLLRRRTSVRSGCLRGDRGACGAA